MTIADWVKENERQTYSALAFRNVAKITRGGRRYPEMVGVNGTVGPVRRRTEHALFSIFASNDNFTGIILPAFQERNKKSNTYYFSHNSVEVAEYKHQ